MENVCVFELTYRARRVVYSGNGNALVVSLLGACLTWTKIGTIGFTATSLSRQLLNGADRDGVVLTLVVLGEGVGPHQWNVPFTAFTPSLLRVSA